MSPQEGGSQWGLEDKFSANKDKAEGKAEELIGKVTEDDEKVGVCQGFWTVFMLRLGSQCLFVVPMSRLGFGIPVRSGDVYGCRTPRCTPRSRVGLSLW